MRFGLAFTLLNDGYFSHELGDTDHGQDWWYDELDHKLGAPLGPARPVAVSRGSDREMMANGGFEGELGNAWSIWFDRGKGCAATVDRDTGVQHAGTAAARITITITGAGRRGGIEFTQSRRALVQGKGYDLRFWARADHPLEITCIASKGSPAWDNYGLNQNVGLTTRWRAVTLTFEATQTTPDARIQFLCGGETGSFWIDDVSLKEHGEEIYRRDFQNGLVLLNGTRRRQTINVGEGYARLKGDHASRYQYILDDGGNPGFKTTGVWREIPLGTKEWHAIPPYFHAWNNRCHTLDGDTGEASWALDLRGPGTHTIQARWAAAPGAKEWSHQAVYEVMAGGMIVSSKTLDQTQNGDEWHTLVERLKLEPGEQPVVRIRNAGGGLLIADALHVFSTERYNDGKATRQVSLEPMDGIVLRRVTPLPR